MATDLDDGLRVRLGHDVRRYDGGRTLVGGMPVSLLYLTSSAHQQLAAGDDLVVGPSSRALVSLLLARGMADPVVEPDPSRLEATTVVIPVRDRVEGLDRLLTSLPTSIRVVVVDDGSIDATGTAAVAVRHRATLVRRQESGGPAAARNAGLRCVSTEFVAFVDSDVDASGPWLETVLAHFDEPAVGLVAPRVLGLEDAGSGWIARYEAVRSSLDLGPRPADVHPRGRVAYVPSACVVARVEAIGAGFDEDMPVAEDVDLIWRLVSDGWRVRYEPAASIRHDHRVDTRGWLARKFFYGTGAALLAQRHGGLVAPVVLAPWSSGVIALLVLQRRWSGVLAVAGSIAASRRLAGRLTRSDHPGRAALQMTGLGVVAALWQLASALTRHWWPLAAAGCLFSSRIRRATLLAAVAEGLADPARLGSDLDPVRFVLARRLDDLAYGSGLWWGGLRARSPRALLPARAGGRARR